MALRNSGASPQLWQLLQFVLEITHSTPLQVRPAKYIIDAGNLEMKWRCLHVQQGNTYRYPDRTRHPKVATTPTTLSGFSNAERSKKFTYFSLLSRNLLFNTIKNAFNIVRFSNESTRTHLNCRQRWFQILISAKRELRIFAENEPTFNCKLITGRIGTGLK